MYTLSGLPAPSSNFKNHAAEIQKALERDGEKLSPVHLCLSEAVAIKLPPLNWNLYHTVPINMTAKNSGFTVMINAEFDQETPYINSGPLTDDYVFSQIHFHWGENNTTGSGHAVSGVRYPLEMHVVHLKKKCANLRDALEIQDGIVVMVHLFGLREDRNTQLDQLTAVLQFIQKNKSCARLYPTALSELVYPFTNNYFLYRGAIGSPKGLYQVLWLVSRTLLPVSSQQLEEFRKLYDPHGTLLLSNASKPYPLDGRSLFLVSPSKRTMDGMYSISHQPAQSNDYDKSFEIRNAEYKSLTDLEEGCCQDNCPACVQPQLNNTANIEEGCFSKVSEGHTLTGRSYIIDSDDEATVDTKLKYRGNKKCPNVVTNVNVTTCRQKSKPRYDPSEVVYSVVSVRGSELHLRRKQPFIGQNEPFTDEDCVLLNKSRAHSSSSAPSLIDTGRYIMIKANHINVNDVPAINFRPKLQPNNHTVTHISSSAPSLTDIRGCLMTKTNNTNFKKVILGNDFENKSYIKRCNRTKDDRANSPNQLQLKYIDTDQKTKLNENKLKCYKKAAIQDFEIINKNQNITNDINSNMSLRLPQRRNLGDSESLKKRFPWYFNQDSAGHCCNCFAEDQCNICVKSQHANVIFQKDKTNKLVGWKEKSQEIIENGLHIPGLENNIPEENIYNHPTEHKVHDQNKEDNYDSSKYYFWHKNENEMCLPKTSSRCIKNKKGKPNIYNVINDKKFLQKVGENSEISEGDLLFIHNFEKVENNNTNEDINREQENGMSIKKYYMNKISPVKSTYDNPIYAIINVDQLHNLNHLPKENNWNHINSNIQRKANPKNNNLLRAKLISGLNDAIDHTLVNYENSVTILAPGNLKTIVTINNPVQANEYKKINLQTNGQNPDIDQHNSKTKQLSNRTKEICSGNHLNDGTSSVDKIIIGKFGKRGSVEVFVTKNDFESIDHPMDDIANQVPFKLVKSKHPKLSYHIEEPLKKSQALMIVKQMDTKITAQSENNQTETNFDSKKIDIPEFNFDTKTNIKKHINYSILKKNKLNNYCSFPYRPSLAQRFQMEVNTTFSSTKKTLPLNIVVDSENPLLETNIADPGSTAIDQKILDTNLTGTSSKAVQTINKMPFDQVREINIKQIFEKNTVHTPKKVEERKIIQTTKDDITSKSSEQKLVAHQNSKSQHAVIINKVELPEPYYIIRTAKQPLVEYNAYNIYPHYPNEIISEPTETTNEIAIARKKTYMTFKELDEAPHISMCSRITNMSNEVIESNKDIDQTQLYIKETNFKTTAKKDENNQDFEQQNVNENISKQSLIDENNVGEPEHFDKETTNKINLQNRLNVPKPEISDRQNNSSKNLEVTSKEIKYKVSCNTSTSERLTGRLSDKNTSTTESERLTVRLSDKNTSTTESEKPIETRETAEKLSVLSPVVQKDNTEYETNEDLKINPPLSQENNNVSETNQSLIDEKNVGESEHFVKETTNKINMESCSTSTSKRLTGRLSDKYTSTTENEKPLDTRETAEKLSVLSPVVQKDGTEYETNEDLKINSPLSQENNNVLETNQNLINMKNVGKSEHFVKETTSVINKKSCSTSTSETLKGRLSDKCTSTTEGENPLETRETAIKLVLSSVTHSVKAITSKINAQNQLNVPKSEISGKHNYSSNNVKVTSKEIKDKVSCSTSISERLTGRLSDKNTSTTESKRLIGRLSDKNTSTTESERLTGRLSDKNTSTTESEKPLETRETTEKLLALSSVTQKDGSEDEPNEDFTINSSLNQENNNVSKTIQLDNSLDIINETISRDLLPIHKADGGITIHIHQDKAKPTVTVEINKSHNFKVPKLNTGTQKLQDHEIKSSSKPKVKLNKSQSTEPCYEKSTESPDNEDSSDDEQLIHLLDYQPLQKSQSQTSIPEQVTQRKSNNNTNLDHLNNINNELKSSSPSKEDTSTSQNKPFIGINELNRSPVKIEMKSAEVKKYPKLNFINHWNVEGDAILENNGKTLRVTFQENTDPPYLNGGPLTGEYKFYELHFHWGPKDCCGAEHIIDGQRFPIEAHFLYIKTVYENLQIAREFVDGIVIVAVILKVGDPPNLLLDELIKDIPLIQDPRTGIYIPAWSMFAWVRSAVTEAKGYFSYKGMLTSQPPHVECVTWIVFPEPIAFCCQQSRAFRKLKSNKGEVLRKNFRHPHPLNSRTMYFITTD